MTHEEALNKLLANCCGQLDDEELRKNGNIQHFMIEMHCSSYLVKAKPLGNLTYAVASVEAL